ncbi:MAG: hypothetical protein AAFQ71_15030 [Planctomycetota bacterium]
MNAQEHEAGRVLQTARTLAESFEAVWLSRRARFARAGTLIGVLLGGILLIELNRRGVSPLISQFPDVHLAAIGWTVTVLLIFEIVEMLLSLPKSVATSVGRHLQVYALVLLRDAFAKLGEFTEPIDIGFEELGGEQGKALAIMGTDAAGAIALFLCATLFARFQTHTPIISDPARSGTFVAIKQAVMLAMLVTLAGLLTADLIKLLGGGVDLRLFDRFFTTLVFVDVLFAVVSLGFTEIPAVVFRNFGFAFAAIMLRLAIASDEFIRPVLGVTGGATALGVTAVYNLSLRPPQPDIEDAVPSDAAIRPEREAREPPQSEGR